MTDAEPLPAFGGPITYYLLRPRAGSRAGGDAGHAGNAGDISSSRTHSYVGLAPRGAHAVVAQPQQARRFFSIDDALTYVRTIGSRFGEFEIEARTTE